MASQPDPQTQAPLTVGILAAGTHPVQTIYLPALQALSNLYTISAIYTSISTSAGSQEPTPTPDTILTNPSISLVLNFMPNEYHELYTIAALQAGKHVMVETPVSLSIPSAKRILAAERDAPNGARVFVACARRYAPCFESVFKKEVAALERIHYARLRMIAGPHIAHTATSIRAVPGKDESGPEPVPAAKHGDNETDHGQDDDSSSEDQASRLRDLMEEVFGKDEQPNRERIALSRFLASLGCHDLGIMRDTLGYPDAISNISVNEPFYSALFHYNGSTGGISKRKHPFTLMYETGTDCVPRCDAQFAVLNGQMSAAG
ncbi:uncharacterized protein DSM5745_04606 [Aspergillus mulundensis]|uniref:Gfo/Idh/MocA-like oxidoreductase N-terminal domain-containing protein n=1 Tax=Aspergillus mulundensis TaxID=1810919 RepID=A0A3D8S434_9EURO|nr:hypothetical protein DSM5745_04606 [Aspergillus mulundensis]RDW81049.1 hypothetical protein DSM5745_04606 [Aspergillus mulundensis]